MSTQAAALIPEAQEMSATQIALVRPQPVNFDTIPPEIARCIYDRMLEDTRGWYFHHPELLLSIAFCCKQHLIYVTDYIAPSQYKKALKEAEEREQLAISCASGFNVGIAFRVLLEPINYWGRSLSMGDGLHLQARRIIAEHLKSIAGGHPRRVCKLCFKFFPGKNGYPGWAIHARE